MAEPTELEILQGRLSQLTRWRTETIESAQRTIEQTNRTYDKEAFSLHRRIKKLLPEEEVTPVTPVTRNAQPRRKREVAFSLDGTEGWTQEEIDHYRELSTRQQGR